VLAVAEKGIERANANIMTFIVILCLS
jgi:hypothetical protein